MSGELEQRVEFLAGEVAQLKAQVAALAQSAGSPLVAPPTVPTAAAAGGDAGEEILDWMGKSTLLPRIAAICFLMVIALVLRTVTDNGLVAAHVGSLAGMAYAALLLGAGWYSYRRGRHLAPIFTVCGAILMYVIVGESHARFEALPSVLAYAILLLTGGVAATISYQTGRPLPVMVGTLGMGLAAVAIDYPSPYFPYLAILLLIANLFGAFATRLQRCSWLRWILLFLTALMMQVWAMKIVMSGRRKDFDPGLLAEPLFLPILALLALVLFGVAILAAVRRGQEGMSRFDLCLPTVTALWVFPAAAYVLRKEPTLLLLLGLLALLLAGGAAVLANVLHNRGAERNSATMAFMVAATALFGMGMGALTSGALSALVALSLCACCLAVLAKTWAMDGLRSFSYPLQVGCGIALAVLLLGRSPGEAAAGQLLAAGLLAAAGLWHYRWSRTTAPLGNTSFFGRLDREDRSAVLLLLSGLMCGFFVLRNGIFLLFGQEAVNAYQAGQSIVISTAAATLMLLAFSRGRNREIRNVAILVTLLAAGRVCLFDLFQVRGMPLVLSVFAFGLTISLVSLALTRWSHPPERKEATQPAALDG